MKDTVVTHATNRDPNKRFKSSGVYKETCLRVDDHITHDQSRTNAGYENVCLGLSLLLDLASTFVFELQSFAFLGGLSGAFGLHCFPARPWSLGGVPLPDVQSATAALSWRFGDGRVLVRLYPKQHITGRTPNHVELLCSVVTSRISLLALVK